MLNLIVSRETCPFTNLAAEETLLDTIQSDTVFLWRNEPSVIIGRTQNLQAEVCLSYAETSRIKVARRITGGGAVYQDLGNINISYIFPCTDDSFDEKIHQFLEMFIDLLKTMDIVPVLTGRNDICIRDKQGDLRKISGTAMTQKKDRGLFHLCLLFDADMDVMERVLTPPPSKLAAKGVASVRSRTINLKEGCRQFSTQSSDEFLTALESMLSAHGQKMEIPSELTSSINELKQSRYENPKWLNRI